MDFKTKTQEELAGMKAEELAQYHQDFIAHKNAELTAKVEGKADTSVIEGLKAEIFSSLQDLTKQLNQALESQIKSNHNKSISYTSLAGSVEQMIDGVKNELMAVGNGTKTGSVMAGLKTAVAMTFAASANVTAAPITVPYVVPGVNEIRKRNPFMLSLVNADTTDSNIIYWVEEVAQVGGAGTTDEGVAKSQVQYKWAGKTASPLKKTIYAEVSKEMLMYPKFVANFVRTKMLADLNREIDAYITATIISNSTAFAAGTLANTVVNPNLYDVIAAAINQAELSEFMPNVVCLNPTDLTKLKLVKDKNEQYVIAPFAAVDGTTIDGLRVITNTGIDAGKCLVLDTNLVNVWFSENVTFEMGLNGNNFKENMKALLAEAQLLTVVPGNNKLGIIYSTIATAITSLKKAS